MRWRDEQGNDQIGTPLKFQEEPAVVRPTLPQMGAHTADIIDKLDLTLDQRNEILSNIM